LTSTKLAVLHTFSIQGFIPGGATTFGSNDQVVNLTGGGFCGWNAPATTFNPFNTNPLSDANQGYDLQLKLTAPSDDTQCKDGAWQTFGTLFKNQGDCVSFLATQGRNQPAGCGPGQ
jgi:hypothetical protein